MSDTTPKSLLVLLISPIRNLTIASKNATMTALSISNPIHKEGN